MSRSQNHSASSAHASGPAVRRRAPLRPSPSSAPAASAPRSASLSRISALPSGLPADSPSSLIGPTPGSGGPRKTRSRRAPEVLLGGLRARDPADDGVVVGVLRAHVGDLPAAV